MSDWQAVILAASRGRDDPIAVHYGLEHKCLLKVGGVPMLKRVVDALGGLRGIAVCVEERRVIEDALGSEAVAIRTITPDSSAPASAMKAVVAAGSYPVLITTGDHALLTPEMVNYVCNMSPTLNADMTVGLATRETISAAYPETKRTYFQFGDHAVSGCNLFTIHNREGLRLLEAWARIDKDRKKPWKLAFAFGPVALFKLLTRRMTLDEAFAIVSRTCNMTVRPLLLPFAEAAIDVDKPADKELAEQILAKRRAKT